MRLCQLQNWGGAKTIQLSCLFGEIGDGGSMAELNIPREQLQKIYDYLKPMASQNKRDGTASLTDIENAEQVGVDLFLSDADFDAARDLAKNFSTGFQINGVWYGNHQQIAFFYDFAVRQDKNDGTFDGKITSPSENFTLVLPEFPGMGNVQEWNALIAPYLDSIFQITKVSINDTKVGTAWIVEKESLGNGQNRYWIITNAHVVDDAFANEIRFDLTNEKIKNQKPIAAHLVNADHARDVAVLYFDSSLDLTPLVVDETKNMSVGEHLTVIGNQKGRGIVQTQGTVNGVERYTSYNMPLIQDDSSALPGNSGSPEFDDQGHVIAICNSGESPGENFGIPSREFMPSYRIIKTTGGPVPHGFLNAEYQRLDNAALKNLGVPSDFMGGLYFRFVPINQALAKAGLKTGDILLTYGDQTITNDFNIDKFESDVSHLTPGSKIKLTYFRNGKIDTITVSVDAMTYAPYPTYEYSPSIVFKEVDTDFLVYNYATQLSEKQLFFYVKEKEGWNQMGYVDKINGQPVRSIDEFKKVTSANTTDENFVIEYLLFTRESLSKRVHVIKNKDYVPKNP